MNAAVEIDIRLGIFAKSRSILNHWWWIKSRNDMKYREWVKKTHFKCRYFRILWKLPFFLLELFRVPKKSNKIHALRFSVHYLSENTNSQEKYSCNNNNDNDNDNNSSNIRIKNESHKVKIVQIPFDWL